MTQEITMGSLFSGSGGFELAGSIFGIRPIWASEIEPFPILVTTKNFPEMKHLGDINKLNGADLEPVTIIAGGSPCQDMSIAGKREGLDGSRSNLFREQIRIVKEMRESDRAAGRTGTQDCRVTIAEDGNVPTLTSRMGTGGGNVPLILSQSHCRSEADVREEVREH